MTIMYGSDFIVLNVNSWWANCSDLSFLYQYAVSIDYLRSYTPRANTFPYKNGICTSSINMVAIFFMYVFLWLSSPFYSYRALIVLSTAEFKEKNVMTNEKVLSRKQLFFDSICWLRVVQWIRSVVFFYEIPSFRL